MSAIVLAALCQPRPARADPVGDATDALPGTVRVPVPVAGKGALAFAGSAGYGWTESVLQDGDSHSRLFGSLAASLQPTSFFAAAIRLDGRYDKDSGPQSSSNEVGDPRLELRAFGAVGGGIRLGGQVGVWFPGGAAPSFVGSAITPDASLLAAFSRDGSPFTLTSRVGFRWDNSSKSVTDADRLSSAERLELGLNQASAVLLGLGVAVRVAPRIEVLADGTWDLLVGNGAPSAAQSPILVSGGARYSLDEAGKLQLQAVLTASPSGRPSLAATAPLVDIEPRVSGMVAVIFRPFARAPEPPAPSPTPNQTVEPAPPPAPVPPPKTAVKGRILAEDGHTPIPHAHLVITPAAGTPVETDTDADGNFEVPGLDPGEVTIAIRAEGFVPFTRKVTLTSEAAPLELTVAKAISGSEVRGIVRDYGGKPIAATIRIEPLGTEVAVEKDGTFHADIEPGTYTVVIHADGYSDQRRKVTVERNGVTMLDVELRKKTR